MEYISNWQELFFRLGSAVVLGGIIGFERSFHGRSAGFRTHILVSLGAALFMVISQHSHLLLLIAGSTAAPPDPSRIAAQIITGIGFLGAGAIMREGLTTHGLTTAACLWVAAGVGMACGAAFYQVAALSTALVLFSLIVLSLFEQLFANATFRHLKISFDCSYDAKSILDLVTTTCPKIIRVDHKKSYSENLQVLSIKLMMKGRNGHETIPAIIQKLEQSGIPIKSVEWEQEG